MLLIGILLYASTALYAQSLAIMPSAEANPKVCESNCCCSNAADVPVGVMNAHTHDKGKWMFEYIFMHSTMSSNSMMMPSESAGIPMNMSMNMDMHMGMLMYGLSRKITLMLMAGYMVNTMNMNMDAGVMIMDGKTMQMGAMNLDASSMGFTDTKVTALYSFFSKGNRQLIGSLGLSLPTGTIMATGTTILGDNQRLSYGMQTGTGSYSITPDVSYKGNSGLFYWGLNAGADIKLNYNSLGYKCGNVYHASTWVGYQLFKNMGLTLRAEDVYTAKIMGADPIMTTPTYADNDPMSQTANYGGQCLNIYAGLSMHFAKQSLQKIRLHGEYGIPAIQNLNGNQMNTKSTFLAGISYAL